MLEKIKQCLDWKDWSGLAVILLLMIGYFTGLSRVPFHPDEATHIFMSKDASTIIQQPLELSWDGELPLSAAERYRAIDAPLSRYLIGAARALTSTPGTPVDWDWSADWSDNITAGAMPSDRQLLVARSALTIPLLVGFLLYYQVVKKALPGILPVFSLLLFGLHPLILLHGRRAMSEGVLTFGVVFFLWAALREKRSPGLIGLALGLALTAKLTAVGLLPAGLVAVSMLPGEEPSWQRILGRLIRFLAAAGLVVAILNPFYWKQPYQALKAGFQARLELANRQLADHGGVLGLQETNLPVQAAAVLAQTYLTPPQTEEVGNYLLDTQQSKQQYLENPLHNWGRGWIAGTALLILSLAGFIFTLLRRNNLTRQENAKTLIWTLASLGTFLALLLPLPWQRYTVPLLPFVVFWTACGLVPLWDKFVQVFRSS